PGADRDRPRNDRVRGRNAAVAAIRIALKTLETHLRRPLLALYFLVACLPALAAPQGNVQYRVTMKAGVKKVHIELTADPGKDSKLLVAIPVWTPGYYQILDFQKGISAFRATDLK